MILCKKLFKGFVSDEVYIHTDEIDFLALWFLKGYSDNHWKTASSCYAVYTCKVCLNCFHKAIQIRKCFGLYAEFSDQISIAWGNSQSEHGQHSFVSLHSSSVPAFWNRKCDHLLSLRKHVTWYSCLLFLISTKDSSVILPSRRADFGHVTKVAIE